MSVLRIEPELVYPMMTTWSGYVRAAAVRSIVTVPGPFCLAMLVQRMNDWVVEVRNAAESKLAALQTSIAPATIAGCIEMLWTFERVGRASDAARRRVSKLTNTPAVQAMLRVEALEGRTDRALRIFQRLLQTPTIDDALLAAARTNPHPRIRALATRTLLTQVHVWRSAAGPKQRHIAVETDAPSLARSALADRATIVRLAGLEYVVFNGRTWPDYENTLLAQATDGRGSLAEMAQWALKVAGIDWIGRLRPRLDPDEAPNPHLARAFGKFGGPADGERIWKIASTLPDERALPFLSAAARLKVDPAAQRLSVISLESLNPTLARRAAKALRDAGVYLSAADLKRAADRGNEFFDRGLASHFKGQSVVAQVNILARLERAHADFDMKVWFEKPIRKINRGAFAITEEEKTELRRLLIDAPKSQEYVKRRLAIAV